jgi:transcriptional regulator with XRE-family HTH domain
MKGCTSRCTGMDDQRIGRALHVLRRRRGLRQSDVAIAAHVSQSLVSDIESGRITGVTVGVLRRVFAAVDAGFEGLVDWRGPALDRLMDADHARVVGIAAERLRRDHWEVRVETSYSVYGERGSIDLFAAKPEADAVVIEEVKTSLASIEATLRKLDEKARLVRGSLCRETFDFVPRRMARILVLPDDTTARRAVARHADVFEVALPARGAQVRRWLREPSGDLAGILFVPFGSRTVTAAARQRIHGRADPGYR